MRRFILAVIVSSLTVIPAVGQGPSPDCPGWRNTTSFVTGNNNFFWSARIGERVYPQGNTDTTTGYYIMSTCADPNATPVPAASITSSNYNSGDDGGITCCSYTNLFDANGKRFQIINASNAGLDQFTINGNNGMQRICPGYNTSIRLGDPRATGSASQSHTWSSTNSNKGAEALFYTMRVMPANALLIINYAVVGRCYSHTALQAGEFLIRVVKQNSDGTWPNAPINDSLWFKVSAPDFAGGAPAAPWVVGRIGGPDCSATTCKYVYKPWTKVAISLSRYLYENVRIELYTSDCIYNVDPIYAYVAGDYQPMRIDAIGCADANSSAVDTLHAPEGLMLYQWFACTTGPDEDIYNTAHMDALNFRQLTEPSTSNIYVPTIDDFAITEGPDAGDTAAKQTFMCKMTSALDPNKPFTSKVYGVVANGKPTPNFTANADCALNIAFNNTSITYGNNELDPDSTRWIIYSDSLATTPIDTLWGNSTSYPFPAEGYYAVSMRVKVAGRECGSIKTKICQAMEAHEVPIILSDSTVCEGEIVSARCSDYCHLDKKWNIGDSLTFISDAQHSYDSITWTPAIGITHVTLTTSFHGLCEATSHIDVKCIGNATITSDVDASLICRGDSVVLSALGVENPHWISVPYDSVLGDGNGQNIVTVKPQVTTTYSAEPSGDSRCIQNASDITIMVLPYPEPTIWTSKPYVDITDPTLTIEDRSPYGNSSSWVFSDGLIAEGQRLEHTFGAIDDTVSISLHTCNEERCCSDTTISLPVKVNAIWVPNTFTPDKSTNSTFAFVSTIPVLEFEIWIYNRNGLLVYHGNDFEKGWDGRNSNGDPCPQGAYAYFYRYILSIEPDRTHTATGTVTLLR